MPRLRDLDLDHHLADPALKPRFVTPMFDLVAPHYDDFTRLFSFGMDRRWKETLVRLAFEHAPAPMRVLDLACGTGDLAFAVARDRRARQARVTGVDASREMLAIARARAATGAADVTAHIAFVEHEHGAAGLAFVEGDLGALPAGDGTVDLVTAGYAFRNAAALAPALAEAARVVRPGGTLAVLDFYQPAFAPWRAAFLAYLRTAGNAVGWLWHREPVAYGYIARSIAAHVSAAEFSRLLGAAGFDVVARRDFLGGGVAIHLGRRRAESGRP